MYVISTNKEASGAWNMALDAFLIDNEWDAPVLRVYRFFKPTVTLGLAQKPIECLHAKGVQSFDVDVCRRVTGGKSLLHDNGLTYTIMVPRSVYNGEIKTSYQDLSSPVFKALRPFSTQLEFAADERFKSRINQICFLEHEVETIRILGNKVVGSAQKRNKKNILQHGEVSLFPSNIPPNDLFISDMSPESLKEVYSQRVGTVFNDYDESKFEIVRQEIIKEFEKMFGSLEEYSLKSNELDEISKRAKELDLNHLFTEVSRSL